ncbi:MAG: integrase [Elainellaceae cyanobacterium]
MPRKTLTVEAINERLKAAKVGVIVWQKGDRLSLRGTFPPKPGSKKTKPHQQIAALGVYANPAGLKFAEAEAMRWGGLLAQQRFTWDEALTDQQKPDSCGMWIEEFKKHALKNLIEAKTEEEAEYKWTENHWYPALKRLNWDAPLTPEEIVRAVNTTKPNTRSRQMACQRLKRFARFAGVEVDLSELVGSYKQSSVKREIPSNEEIEQAIDAMTNPQWQWIAGMMAAYGLRDHEAFQCELYQRPGSNVWFVRVLDGKTEYREIVPPIPEAWVERWQLWDIRRPRVTAKINKIYGTRTSTAFTRQKMPFRPYSLRHAYAIRGSLEYDYQVAVMAKWLGHDPNVYLSIYQRHITDAQSGDIYLRRQGQIEF